MREEICKNEGGMLKIKGKIWRLRKMVWIERKDISEQEEK
jgi:hypothetical protein